MGRARKVLRDHLVQYPYFTAKETRAPKKWLPSPESTSKFCLMVLRKSQGWKEARQSGLPFSEKGNE